MKNIIITLLVFSGLSSVLQAQDLGVTFSVVQPSCGGNYDGSATAVPSGGTAPYFYKWNTGATTQSIQDLNEGTYSVTVTDWVSSTAIKSVTLSEPITLSCNIDIVERCSDATFTATARNGVGPYTYQWSNGASGNVLTVNSSGVYCLTITDINGCSEQKCRQVNLSGFDLTTTSVGVSCTGYQNGSASAHPSGGNPPYTYQWSNGGTTQTISGLIAGVYMVTVTDTDGCSAEAFEIVESIGALDVRISGFNPSCESSMDGKATAEAMGGTAPYTYQWSNGQSGTMATNIGAGIFYVTVTDANACQKVVSVSLIHQSNITASVLGGGTLCSNANNGTLTASAANGVAPYTYQWSNGSNSNAIGGLSSGTYTVTVTDFVGCTAIASGTIHTSTALNINIIKQNPSCTGGTGTLTANVSGGTAPYTYAWSNGASSNAIGGLGTGTYTLVVTDALGCTNTATETIFAPATLSATTNRTNLSCHGSNDGTASIQVSGGTSPYSYAWNNGATSNAIGGLAVGTYSVVVSDANGCTITRSIQITQPTPLVLSLSKQDATCGNANGTITASVSGGTTGYSYAWNNFGTSNAIGGLAAGTYSLTVTDANGCTAIESMTINSSSNPEIVRIDKQDVSCAGYHDGQLTAIVQSGTPPYSYNWSNGATSQSITGLGAGTYTVSVYDALGCSAERSRTVNSPSPLEITLAKTNVACHGGNTGTASVTANGGTAPYSYAWNNFGTSNAIGSLSAGTYSVTVADANGCTRTASVVVEQPSPLVVTLSKQDATCGNANGTITASVSGGTAGYSYAWNNFGTSNAIGGLAGGTYSLTVTDANGCTAIESMTINSSSNPEIVRIDKQDVSCAGYQDGQLTAIVQSGTPPYSYNWSNGGTSQSITGLGAGTYTVTVYDVFGCSAERSRTINSPSPLGVTLEKTNVACHGGNTGTASVTASGGTAPYSYTWNNFGTSNAIGSLSAGTYSVTVTDANGCTRTASVVVEQPSPLVVTLTKNNEICDQNNGTARASVSGGTAPYSYAWNNFGASDAIGSLSAGTYTVSVTDAHGCTEVQSITLDNIPGPSITTISSRDISCENGSDGELTVHASNGTTPYSYTWSNGGTTATIRNLRAGTYTVTLSDANGCTAVESATLSQPSSIEVQFSVTDVLCHGEHTGAASVQVSGGTPPYSYTWSNGSTSNTITNVGAANYSINISDANGCTVIRNLVIQQPTPIDLLNTRTNTTCGEHNGVASVSASGGLAPYTYRWDTGATTTTITGLSPRRYFVSVTDANGCEAVGSSLVNMTAIPMVLRFDVFEPLCHNGTNGAATAIIAGGRAPYAYTWSNGGTNQYNGNLSAGTYGVTVIDADGCVISDAVTIGQPDAIQLDFVVTDNTCNDNEGFLRVIPTGGLAPYTYAWSNFAGSDAIGNLSAGTYRVTVTDANGCATIGIRSIAAPFSTLSVELYSTNVSCHDGNDGSAQAIAVGGTAPYTYSWNNGATSANVNNLTGGFYEVTVTDAAGCTASQSIYISNPTNEVGIEILEVQDKDCGNNEGRISVRGINGTAPYTYTWSNGATSSTITNLSAGTYRITVTDANGCTVMGTIIIYGGSSPVITFTKQDIICANENTGTITAHITGGTAPYTYAWNNFGASNAIGGLAAGTYTLTVTDANGCTAVAGETINHNSTALGATVSANDATCHGEHTGSATVNVTGGITPYYYTWSNGATSATATGLAAGTYTVTVSDQNGCEIIRDVQVGGGLAININITHIEYPACGNSNGSISVNATGGVGGYTYTWSNGAITNTINGLSGGTYTLTVSDANACTATQTINLDHSTAMIVDLIVQDIHCGQDGTGSITATVTGGAAPHSYTWNNGATTSTISNLAAGTYTVSVVDANGCVEIASAIIRNESTILTIDIALATPSCHNGNDGSILAAGWGGTPPYTYQWSTGLIESDTEAEIGSEITDLPAGIYHVTVTDAQGCQVAQAIDVSNPSPIVVVTDNIMHATCGANNGSVEVSASGGTAPYTYAWSNTATASSLNSLLAGTYTLSVTDTKGCLAIHNVTIHDGTGPEIVRIDQQDTNCAGGADGILSVIVADNTASYTYAWSNGATTPTATGLSAGTYTVSVTDANGCTTQASATIQEQSTLNVNFVTANADCGAANGSATAQVTGGVAPYTFYWNTGLSSASISGLSAGVYTVNVSDANGCTTIATAYIDATDAPTLVRIDKQEAECHGQASASLTVVVEGGASPYSYAWSNGANTASIYNLVAGNYAVTISGANGCSVIGTATINAPALLDLTISSSNPDCGGNTGTATATVTGGTAPYTYFWSTSATTSTISDLSAGTYALTVTDANGCSINQSVTLNAGASDLSCDVRIINDLSNSENPDAIIEVWVDNGTAPYSFYWNTGSFSQILMDVGPGTYSVTVTDANGCTTVCTNTVVEICAEGKNITNAGWIGPDRVVCGPNVPVGLINSSEPAYGGDEDCEIEYLWLYTSDGNDDVSNWTPIENSNTATYDPGSLAHTSYFIRCARRGQCPYIESNPVRIEVDDMAVADIQGPDFVCLGEEVTYTTPDFRARGGFTWSFTGATPLFAINTEQRVVFHTVGFQYITLRVEREDCISTDTLRVFVTDSPQLCGQRNDDSPHIEIIGERQGLNTVALSWILEENTAIYEVEHSRDGENFEVLATIDTPKSKNEEGKWYYQYLDEGASLGSNYYRVNMLDENGNSFLSNIIEIVFPVEAQTAFSVYPNPVNEVLQVTISKEYEGGGVIELLRLDGTSLQSTSFDEIEHTKNIDISDQAPALYLIRVSYDNGAVMVKKLLKQ